MNRAENRTLLQVPFCREWGCGRGDFEGELAQLGVPCADVRTGGEIVWAKRVAHRLSLYLVRARNFLVALIPRSGTSPTSSLPAEYVLKNLSVFVRSVNEGSEQNSGKAMNPCILLLFIPSCVTVQEIIQRCSCRCLYHSLKASHFRSSDIEHKTRQWM